MMNFQTPAKFAPGSILTVEDFRTKAAELIASMPLSDFDQWIDDFHYFIGEEIPVEDEMPEDAEERAEIEAEGRKLLLAAIVGDYSELVGAITGDNRFVDWTNVGGVTVWFSGGTSFGDSPFEGWDELRAGVCIPDYLPAFRPLIPWLLTTDGNFEKYADTEVPQAAGLMTKHAHSILLHTAMTHPDPAVRAEIAADLHMHFTVEELTALSNDEDEAVRLAASRRMVEMTTGN